MTAPVRIATRTSDLALAQARMMASELERALGVRAELLPLKTTGDRLQGPLTKLGGKGLFVKEIEEALLEGRADLAVHSGKDLPAQLPVALELVAFPERADPRDALVTRPSGGRLADLPRGARIGTGSVRRTALLRAQRPDLEVVPLRGNVPTRLRKLEDDDLSAVVLACAGLERLGLAGRIDERIAPEAMLPAVAQGILAIEGRRGDPIAEDARALCHGPTRARAAAERGVLERLGADCNVPLAALATPTAAGLRLRTCIAHPAGAPILRAEGEAPVEQAADLGRRLAEELLASGGEALLASLREDAP
jgi:hydroxymethylbilane synthase